MKKTNKNATKEVEELIRELDIIGERIKEYSYDSFSDDKGDSFTENVSVYIEENGTFQSLLLEYNEKMEHLCKIYYKLEDAEKYA